VRLPDPQRSRAVLIGTSTYKDENLPDVPQVRANISGLTAILTDPVNGVIPAANCEVIEDEGNIRLIGARLRGAADQAEDLLLVYFAGHGLLGAEHDLYLGLPYSKQDDPEFTSLEYKLLRKAVLKGRKKGQTRVVILDCCYSGRATRDTLAGSAEVLGQLAIDGSYVLAAAPAYGKALVLPGEEHTAFTGRLLRLLQEGEARGPELLTVDYLYRELLSRMRAEGLPEPDNDPRGTSGLLALARNRAVAEIARLRECAAAALAAGEAGRWDEAVDRLRVTAEEMDRVARPDHRDALRVRRSLARAIGSAGDSRQAATMLDALVAEQTRLFGADDEDTCTSRHYREVSLGEASRRERRNADEDDQAGRTRRDRRARVLAIAERAAGDITATDAKAIALAKVAEGLSDVKPDRARLLIADAVKTAESITDEAAATVFGAAAKTAWVAANLWFTRSYGGSVQSPDWWDIGTVVRVGEAIGNYLSRGQVLAPVAEAMTAIDPARAERLALSIADKDSKVLALTAVAAALESGDPWAHELLDEAERTARTITDKRAQVIALVQVAKTAAASDPARVGRLVTEVEREVQGSAARATRAATRLGRSAKARATEQAKTADSARVTRHKCWKAQTLADAAPAAAAAAPSHATELIVAAHRTVASITSEDSKQPVLASVATGLFATATALLAADPSRASWLFAEAEILTQDITNERVRVAVLASAANALRVSDPGRADKLITDAEQAARSITERFGLAQALACVATAAVGTMQATALFEDAERLARVVIAENLDTSPLADVAAVLAASNPDLAETIAASIAEPSLRASTLVRIAAAL
jgi:caspase domain-containing protein